MAHFERLSFCIGGEVPLYSVSLNLNHEKKQNSNQSEKVEKKVGWYLSKLLTITITSFNFLNCPVKL